MAMTDQASLTRLPPHSDEAEMALLGAILSNNKAYERVSEFLRPEHFASRVHTQIYQAIERIIERGQIADPIVLKGYFDANSDLSDIGGFQYLVRLCDASSTIISAGDYGRTIFDLFQRRQLIEIGEEITESAFAFEMDRSAADQIEMAEKRLSVLAETGSGGSESRQLSDALGAMLAEVSDARERGGKGIGLPSGLNDLDAILGGIAPGNLIILGARPSMGKSAVGFAITRNLAAAGVPVGAFSLEMRAEDIGPRLASDTCNIPYNEIRRGALSDHEWSRLQDAERQLRSLKMHIDETPGLTVHQIRARARRMKRRHGIGFLLVDHLHLIRGKSASRLQELTEISGVLKETARELEIPVLVLAQLSRALESRDDKRPQLSDLRESGSIEQDADAVMFLYRKSYYLEREQPQRKSGETERGFLGRLADWHADCSSERNRAEILVQKNRHGQTGTVALYCDLALSRFRDLARTESF